MSHHARRFLTPGASRKRKERESFYAFKPSALSPAQAAASTPSKAVSVEPAVCSNRLLAGYMAFEFLTKGTLFGQKFDPGRAQTVPSAGSSEELKNKPVALQATSVKEEHKSYAEVASILKTEGAHIPGIVNPTQLARWIQN